MPQDAAKTPARYPKTPLGRLKTGPRSRQDIRTTGRPKTIPRWFQEVCETAQDALKTIQDQIDVKKHMKRRNSFRCTPLKYIYIYIYICLQFVTTCSIINLCLLGS